MGVWEDMMESQEDEVGEIEKAVPANSVKPNPASLKELGKEPGVSRYFEPLAKEGLRGNSRDWGDAAPATKVVIAKKIMEEAKKRKLSKDEMAAALAIVDVESGFNPDAAVAVKHSSAAGLAQILRSKAKDITARKVANLDEKDVFDTEKHIPAFFDLLSNETFKAAKKLAGEDKQAFVEYIYRVHHEGPGYKKGRMMSKGGEAATQKYLLAYDKYKKIVDKDIAMAKAQSKDLPAVIGSWEDLG